MKKEQLLDLIITKGISTRQIPLARTESFYINSGNEVFVTSKYIVEDVIRKENVSFEQFSKYQKEGCFTCCKWEDNKIIGKKAIKTTNIEYGGWWMTKFSNSNSELTRWSMKKDNLAETLEESVNMLLNTNK